MESGLSAVIFDTFFTVNSQQRTRGHHEKLLNIEVLWMFGNTFPQSELLIDGTKCNEILTVEVSTVSRTDLKDSVR